METAVNLKDTRLIQEIDLALKKAREQDKQTVDQQKQQQQTERDSTKARGANLALILRTVGATVLLAAAFAFLVQHWGGLDHLFRYGAFLSFTIVLSIAGFFCGLRLQEDKGARTFLAVAAAIMPVHFCQLGALIYSRVVGPVHSLPEYLIWVAPSVTGLLIALCAAAICLPVIVRMSFSALARSEASRLTVAYLLCNLPLLIPTRNPDITALIGLMLASGVILFDVFKLQPLAIMRTKEGYFVRVMMTVPFVIMVGRLVLFYSATAFLAAMMFAVLAAALFIASPAYAADKSFAKKCQEASMLPAAIAWTIFGVKLSAVLSFHGGLPFIGLPIAAIFVLMSLHTVGDGAQFRRVATYVGVASVVCELLAKPSMTIALLSIVVGALVFLYGYETKLRAGVIGGSIGVIAGVAYHLKFAITLYNMSPWLSLGAFGIIAVIASSYVERNYESLRNRIMALVAQSKSWN